MSAAPPSAPVAGVPPAPATGERPLSRHRDCDPATSLDLQSLEDAGVRYEILHSTPQATTLRLTHLDLAELRSSLTEPPAEPYHGDCVYIEDHHQLEHDRDDLQGEMDELVAVVRRAIRDLASVVGESPIDATVRMRLENLTTQLTEATE